MEEVPAAASSFPDVALLHVVVAALAMMAISTVWYSPRLFGKAWVRHTGIRAKDLRSGEKRRGYIVAAIASLLMAYLLGIISAHAGHSRTFFCGVALVWFFVIVEQLNGVLWRRDPIALFFLQAFRSLFALTGGALVFYFWS